MFPENIEVYIDVFGTAATLSGVAVSGVFDRPHQLAAVGLSGMASTQPTFTLPTSQVPTDVVGLALAVLGNSYVVAAHEPDGTGMSLLLLETA